MSITKVRTQCGGGCVPFCHVMRSVIKTGPIKKRGSTVFVAFFGGGLGCNKFNTPLTPQSGKILQRIGGLVPAVSGGSASLRFGMRRASAACPFKGTSNVYRSPVHGHLGTAMQLAVNFTKTWGSPGQGVLRRLGVETLRWRWKRPNEKGGGGAG